GFFLLIAIWAYFTMSLTLDELKPMVRQSTEDTLIDTANLLAIIVKEDVKAGRINTGAFTASLHEASQRVFGANVWGVSKNRTSHRIYITDDTGIVIFDTDGNNVGKDYSQWRDVYLTLKGKYGARSTKTDPTDELSTVMYVAAPIKDGTRIIGSLTVAKPNRSVQKFIDRGKYKLIRDGLIVLATSLAIGMALSFWLTFSLRRLSQYALNVSHGKRVELPAVTGTELAGLGRAIETMRTKLEGKEYVEEYVHTLTHELKSPLAAIAGAAELLTEDMDPPERKRFLSNIQGETHRMQTIVERMLDLAVIERRQSLQNVETINLKELINDILEPKRGELAVKQLQIHEDLPDTLCVCGERFLLRQALGNLIDNALAFTAAGGILTVQGAIEGGYCRIQIRDTGIGIPDYALCRVFNRFYSLPRPDSGKKGTGIGLSFVQEVALLHGGTIDLQNNPGGGATATIRIPA
ncbi:MAG: two-component system sensor histidine kinase CreC, partial [Nitrospira sp.]|nr:two-component system sensor histidine kinase CreC [Nitrospira sp.]